MNGGGFEARFAAHLRDVAGDAGKARATLRRSLSFRPGTWPAAFPYVEPFVATQSDWTRKVAYLVAGLYAVSSKDAQGDGSLGDAAARLQARSGSDSVETRFLTLLDADDDQLAHRLRQMVTLMAGNDLAPHWPTLLRHLRAWQRPERWVQERWARDFYRNEAAGDEGTAGDDEAGRDDSGETSGASRNEESRGGDDG